MSKKIFTFVLVATAMGLIGATLAQAQISLQPLSFNSLNNSNKIKDNKEKIKKEVEQDFDIKIDEIKYQEPIEEPITCGEPIVDRDGFVYNTVQIGDLCWMAENLKTKTKADNSCINGGTAPCADASVTDNGKGRACYDNLETNCDADGALYTFAGIEGNIATVGEQGICPTGWHIPTQNELTNLERSVCTSGTCETDFPYDSTTTGYRGTDEGTSLKQGGCSGFNAVLSGRREANGVTFAHKNWGTWLWSSEYDIPSIHRRLITADSGQIFRDAGNLSFNRSQSLRCVRNMPIPSFCGETITDRDGYTYKTVRIGDQCWMGENLKTKTKVDGSCINGGSAPCPDASVADNGKGRSCYGNLEANCTSKGALYTFTGIGGNIVSAGEQGICPTGWHIPTQNEFTTLERAVCTSGSCETDFPYDTSTYGLRGTNEGASLKEGGCSRFNAVMSGRREANGSTFAYDGWGTWLWSSQYSIPSVHRRTLFANSDQVYRDAGNLTFNRAQSLRCIKNI